MITLITFPETFGEFAASPFCTKAAYLLEMSGQNWQREDVLDPRPFKYGKLPAIRTAQGEIICDSENIRAYLEGLGADFDHGLSAGDKASARAFIRMADEHMYFHQVLDRWGNDEIFAVLQQAYFREIPCLVRAMVTRKLRRNLLNGMNVQGLGRFGREERLARLEYDLCAISARLDDRPFLFGENPVGADASVAAILGGMRASPVATLQSHRVAGDVALMEYVARMEVAVPIKRSGGG